MDGERFDDRPLADPARASLLGAVIADLAVGKAGSGPADVAQRRPGWLATTVPHLPDLVLVQHYDPNYGEELTAVQRAQARGWVAVYRAKLEETPGRWDIRDAEDQRWPGLYVRRPTPRHLELQPRDLLDDGPDPFTYTARMPWDRLSGYTPPTFGGRAEAEIRCVVGRDGVLLPIDHTVF